MDSFRYGRLRLFSRTSNGRINNVCEIRRETEVVQEAEPQNPTRVRLLLSRVVVLLRVLADDGVGECLTSQTSAGRISDGTRREKTVRVVGNERFALTYSYNV